MTESASERVQILLAEDNPGDVWLIREALKQHGVRFDLHVVEDGEKAMRFIGKVADPGGGRPDLILLDLNLPKSDGRDILKAIKETPLLKSIPVIILTSSDSPRDRLETALMGADCYVRKPCTLDEFMQIGAIAKQAVAGR